jgi:hypothetical protein
VVVASGIMWYNRKTDIESAAQCESGGYSDTYQVESGKYIQHIPMTYAFSPATAKSTLIAELAAK